MQSFRVNLCPIGTPKTNKNNISDSYKEFDFCFLKINQNIESNQFNENEKNIIYASFKELIEASCKLNRNIVELQNEAKEVTKINGLIMKAEDYIRNEINEYRTTWRRNKILEKSPSFVQPQQKAIGIKWDSKIIVNDNIVQHNLKQCEFTYVPIIETLKVLFSDEKFIHAFKNSEHICSDNQYERFCCGKIAKRLDLFNEGSEPIKLLLAIDEFEPCSALKTKAGLHKTCAIYMQIVNLPQRLLSKLENIHLVALCLSENLKQQFVSLDNILELIVAEIRFLEETGLRVGDAFIKGTLVHNAFDNLGGNELFGFVKSFNAQYYCRICDLSKEDCSKTVREQSNQMRKIDEYSQQIAEIQGDGNNIKGVTKVCLLNNLKYFHILQNTTVDLMHDISEGVIQFLLNEIFGFCIERKILTKQQLACRIRDFNYGHLCQKSKPSRLKLQKKNLNQNASQSYCLMVNLPFILFDVKDELEEIWICIETLLKIMRILFSNSIQESDVTTLEGAIESHLKNYIDIFKTKLKPKHHMLTHYPSIIRNSGPVKNFWMMRMEAKHKFFTEHTKKTKNFIDITKTLALKHQRWIANRKPNYEHDIKEPARSYILKDPSLIAQISESLELESTMNLYEIVSLTFNDVKYHKGLMLAQNKCFLEIMKIISNKKKLYCFVCLPYKVKRFDHSLNSFEIEKDLDAPLPIIISYESLIIKKCFESIRINMMMFIKLETLDLRIENFI